MKEELRQHAAFAKANKNSNIVSLLNIVDTVCLGGEFGNTHGKIYWMLNLYKKLFNYTKISQKDTRLLLKDLSDLYDVQVSQTGSLVCGKKLMEDILAENLWQGTTMAHYFDPENNINMLACNEEYKQQVMLQFIIMLVAMRPK